MGSIRALLEEALAGLPGARAEPFKGHPIARLIRRDLCDAIAVRIDGEVTATVGRGRWAETPRIAIGARDEAGSAFVALLLCGDGAAAELSLQVAEEEGAGKGRRRATARVAARAAELADALGADTLEGLATGGIDLGARGSVTRRWQAASVASVRYTAGDVPDDERIGRDIERLVALRDGVEGAPERADEDAPAAVAEPPPEPATDAERDADSTDSSDAGADRERTIVGLWARRREAVAREGDAAQRRRIAAAREREAARRRREEAAAAKAEEAREDEDAPDAGAHDEMPKTGSPAAPPSRPSRARRRPRAQRLRDRAARGRDALERRLRSAPPLGDGRARAGHEPPHEPGRPDRDAEPAADDPDRERRERRARQARREQERRERERRERDESRERTRAHELASPGVDDDAADAGTDTEAEPAAEETATRRRRPRRRRDRDRRRRRGAAPAAAAGVDLTKRRRGEDDDVAAPDRDARRRRRPIASERRARLAERRRARAAKPVDPAVTARRRRIALLSALSLIVALAIAVAVANQDEPATGPTDQRESARAFPGGPDRPSDPTVPGGREDTARRAERAGDAPIAVASVRCFDFVNASEARQRKLLGETLDALGYEGDRSLTDAGVHTQCIEAVSSGSETDLEQAVKEWLRVQPKTG